MAYQENLLDENELYRDALMPAKWTKRLANFVIDYLLFFILFFSLSMALGVVAVLVLGEEAEAFINRIEKTPPLLDRLITSVLFCLYCLFLEVILKGRTLGKAITKTRVVSLDGSRPTLNQLIKRNFTRLVPLDAFSFFAETPQGWHDRWADTYVVDDKSLPNGQFLPPLED